MKKIIILKLIYTIIILQFFSLYSYAQPSIQWQNTIGGTDEDLLTSSYQTKDGGYILFGYSKSNISVDKTEGPLGIGYDYWVVKVDSLGAIEWDNTIGGNNNDVALQFSIRQTNDGGYIIGGQSELGISFDKTEDNIGLTDYWVVKLDSMGVIQGQKRIGGTGDDFLRGLDLTSDGGYILSGRSNSNIFLPHKSENSMGGFDYWVVKLDSNLIEQWDNTIGGAGDDVLFSVKQNDDGGYILGGYSNSDSSSDKSEYSHGGNDYWIVKLDALGNIQWENTIGGDSDDVAVCIQQTNDEGYIALGSSNSTISGDKTDSCKGGYDYWFVKLDSTGNTQWQKSIGGSLNDDGQSIEQTIDLGYIAGGDSYSNISGDKTDSCRGYSDYWVLKLDSSGNMQWQKTVGGNDEDFLYNINQSFDGGFIIGGRSASDSTGDKTENNQMAGTYDYWVVKLVAEITTNVTSTLIIDIDMNVYPNPSSGNFTIDFGKSIDSKNHSIIIRNVLSQTIYETKTNQQKVEVKLPENTLPGIYFLEIRNEKNEIFGRKKLVVN